MVVFGVFSDFGNQKLENSKKFPQKIENSQFFCFVFLVNFLQRLKKNYTNLRKHFVFFKTVVGTFYATSTATGYPCYVSN